MFSDSRGINEQTVGRAVRVLEGGDARAGRAGRFHRAGPLLQRPVLRLDLQGEVTVGQRILVGAVDQGVFGKGLELEEGCVHLFRGAFKDSAASGKKEGVAAEQERLLFAFREIDDVSLCVSRGIHDPEGEADLRDFNYCAFFKGMGTARNGLPGSAVHGDTVAL